MSAEKFRKLIANKYSFEGESIILGAAMLDAACLTESFVRLPLKTFNRHGLIAGAIAVAGATVEGARIATLTNGMALDTFYIEDAGGGPFDSPTRLAKLSALIERALSGQLRMIAELSKQTSPLPSRCSPAARGHR